MAGDVRVPGADIAGEWRGWTGGMDAPGGRDCCCVEYCCMIPFEPTCGLVELPFLEVFAFVVEVKGTTPFVEATGDFDRILGERVAGESTPLRAAKLSPAS